MRAYVTIRTAPNQGPAVGRALKTTVLAKGAARILGAFAPQIGASVNTLFAILTAHDTAALDRALADLSALPDVVSAGAEALTPAAERNLPLLIDDQAMFTNRWFHVLSDKSEAFQADTIPVWDQFETDTRCHVIGLWHLPPKDGVTSYLLVARYADLLTWSNSRYYNMPQDGEPPAWATSFARRRSYMTDTSVIATRCLGGGPD